MTQTYDRLVAATVANARRSPPTPLPLGVASVGGCKGGQEGSLHRANALNLKALTSCPTFANCPGVQCLHRFCHECIRKYFSMTGPNSRQCPICRKKLISGRDLRPDDNFDKLIATIFPDRSIFELHHQQVGPVAAARLSR